MAPYVRLFLLITCILPLNLATACAQLYQMDRPYRNYSNYLNLKGKVRELKEYRYKSVDPKKSTDGQPVLEMYLVYSFDVSGNLLWHALHRADHSIGNLQTYTYNSAGQLTSSTDTDPGTPGYGTDRTYTYDAEGRLVHEKSVSKGSGRTIMEKTYAYDSKGRLLSTSSSFPFDNSSSSIAIDYSGKNDIVTYISKRKGDNSKTIRSYQGRSNRVELERHSYEKAIGSHSTYNYNKVGDIASLERFEGDSKTPHIRETFDYSYDGAGNWTTRHNAFITSLYQTEKITKREISYYP